MMEENWNGTGRYGFLKKPYNGANSELLFDYEYPYGTHNAMIKDIECSYNEYTGKGNININFQMSGITEDTDSIERAYRSFIAESNGRTGSPYDNVWWNWFEIFKEYVFTYDKLPVSKTCYKGMQLGSWFRRQIERARIGILSDSRIQAINSVYPCKWY